MNELKDDMIRSGNTSLNMMGKQINKIKFCYFLI